MRLFVAIALTAEAAEALARVRERLAAAGDALRWTEPESWHVTLQFLGNASEEQASCVAGRLAEVRAERVPVRLEGLGFFARAGVFYAGVALTPELLALEQKVTAATRGCGFLPEERAYNPHITLARVKGRGAASALRPLQQAVERNRTNLAAEFVAEEFLLYESFPGPEGSRYEVRGRWPLGGARHQRA
jgi:2'-5' RNA ligase